MEIPFALLLLVAGIGALVRGARIERRGALMFIVAWLTSLIMKPWPPGPWLFLNDLGVMIGLIALSWKSPRPWPVYACGFQTLLLATRIASGIDPDVNPRVLQAMLDLAGGAAILMLAIWAWLPPKPAPTRKIK